MKNAADHPVTVPDHIHHVADDLQHVVVMNAQNGQIFGLDNTAALIWNVLTETGSERAAAAALVERYDVEPDQAAADVRTFLDDLVGAGLLVRDLRGAAG
ncbi:PqqD family protein [Flindersiella endophytica]